MGFKSFLVEMAPFAAMVALETIVVGNNTLNKAAISEGMSRYFLIFYSSVLAAIIIFPFALFFRREKTPPLSFCILWKVFLSSLIGRTLSQEFLYAGLDYSSPTLASAMRNLIPAITFVLAVIFRMENLNLRSSRSQMKIMATLLSILGAITVIIYKGPSLFSFSSKTSVQMQSPLFFSDLLVEEHNWALGGILLACSSVCTATWIISMGAILKEYPSEISIIGFYFLFASIQCFAVSLVAERNHPNAWKISADIQLIAVIYHGIFVGAIACCMEAWCIHKKGPLFVAMFKPLSIPIAALVAFIFLGEPLHTGTIVGGGIVIMGLYGVIWAKSRENEEQQQESEGDFPCSSSSSQKTPLLQNSVDV